MSRTVPQCPCPVAVTTHHPGKQETQYRISVITPLVGGGVEPHRNDPIWLIRPTAVRGHLRFWWRATRGMDFRTTAELFAREGQIWGTTKGPGGRALASPVEIEISILNGGQQVRWQDFRKAAYVLFAFRQIPNGQVQKGVCFSLFVRYPLDLRDDVETAIWAWVNFGGIGARTRRGCGALFCPALSPPNQDIANWFEQQRQDRGLLTAPANPHAPWTCLAQRPLVHLLPTNPIDAWDQAVALLRDFRQEVGFARNPGAGGRVPGRSRWPEADSIRAI
ncbi:MAG: type III-B CRISPR module RAMP protein Cmr1, partial [Bryobacteraceae bacterium]